MGGKRRELNFRSATNDMSIITSTGTATTAAGDTKISEELVAKKKLVVVCPGDSQHDSLKGVC